ncbi:hypothetical protein EVAR_101483_1 [Eumeta japonica]|uniref:Uncharacterized protein n=1 Tax=Eumeta variegata TaxID=151549 RepID=A0A4C1SVE8_EUMVA|nr:hypothetical protein EVAR_101483_1 [Eumeta japonica]
MMAAMRAQWTRHTTNAARGRPIIVEWERDARHSAGLSRSVTHRYVTERYTFISDSQPQPNLRRCHVKIHVNGPTYLPALTYVYAVQVLWVADLTVKYNCTKLCVKPTDTHVDRFDHNHSSKSASRLCVCMPVSYTVCEVTNIKHNFDGSCRRAPRLTGGLKLPTTPALSLTRERFLSGVEDGNDAATLNEARALLQLGSKKKKKRLLPYA